MEIFIEHNKKQSNSIKISSWFSLINKWIIGCSSSVKRSVGRCFVRHFSLQLTKKNKTPKIESEIEFEDENMFAIEINVVVFAASSASTSAVSMRNRFATHQSILIPIERQTNRTRKKKHSKLKHLFSFSSLKRFVFLVCQLVRNFR